MGLLNILEERDVKVRGYTVRLPLDLLVVASANPEDYTSRGRIVTLQGSARLAVPGRATRAHPRARARLDRTAAFLRTKGPPVVTPAFMLEVVAELSLSRRAQNQPAVRGPSGSASPIASVLGRGPPAGGPARRASAAPRMSDLGAVLASTVGKVELGDRR